MRNDLSPALICPVCSHGMEQDLKALFPLLAIHACMRMQIRDLEILLRPPSPFSRSPFTALYFFCFFLDIPCLGKIPRGNLIFSVGWHQTAAAKESAAAAVISQNYSAEFPSLDSLYAKGDKNASELFFLLFLSRETNSGIIFAF